MPSITDDYHCRDGLYHDYSDLVADTKYALVERCKRCGHKIIFNKAEKGRIDSKRYCRTHEQEVMQINHREFKKYYKPTDHKGSFEVTMKGNKR